MTCNAVLMSHFGENQRLHMGTAGVRLVAELSHQRNRENQEDKQGAPENN